VQKVLIKNNEIIMVSDGTVQGNADLADIDDGIYTLKMVGDKVKDLRVSIRCSQFYFPDYNELLQRHT
jgi:hypothetical protein